jgi:hypothetical protein
MPIKVPYRRNFAANYEMLCASDTPKSQPTLTADRALLRSPNYRCFTVGARGDAWSDPDFVGGHPLFDQFGVGSLNEVGVSLL